MLKVGLDKEQSVLTTKAAASGGCGCNKAAVVKMTQDEKQKKLQALTERMNKTKNSIYKTKTPIF